MDVTFWIPYAMTFLVGFGLGIMVSRHQNVIGDDQVRNVIALLLVGLYVYRGFNGVQTDFFENLIMAFVVGAIFKTNKNSLEMVKSIIPSIANNGKKEA